MFYTATFIDSFKKCHCLTLYLQQEAAMLLLEISLVCSDGPSPPGWVRGSTKSPRTALSGLTMAMGRGAQTGRDLEAKNYVNLPSHISGCEKEKRKRKRKS